MDDAGDRGPDLFRMQATSLLAAGLRPGSVFGEETVTRPERLAQLKPSVRAWCISENAISAFRMTDLFRNLDRSREEVLVSIPDGLNLPPFEARQRAWTALFPLISYGGRTSLLLGSDPDGPEPDLPVELDGRPVTCAALERLRDAVDDLLFYRYLQAEVVPALQPPQDAELLRSALGQIAGTQEGAMIRFVEKARGGTPRGDSAPIPHAHPVWDTDASNNDYRKAHAELLRLMERYGPRRQAQ
jgi:hypothetical protein